MDERRRQRRTHQPITDLPDVAVEKLKALLFEEGKTWREVLRQIPIQIQVQKYLDEIGVTWEQAEALLHKDAE